MRIPVAIVGHATSRGELQAMVDATALVNGAMLAARRFGPLYESGIRYRNERRGEPNPGVERFQTVDSLYELGFGDCDDLAPARAAELRMQGERARPWVVRNPGGGWHVVVLRWDANGTPYIEDPSARMGMLGPEGEMSTMDESVMGVGIYRRVGRRHVAAVGYVCGSQVLASVGTASEDENPESPEPAKHAKARAMLRAFRGAATKGAHAARTLYGGGAARGAAQLVKAASKASRGAASTETMANADVDETTDDDEATDDVNGFGFDDVAWSMWRAR